MSLPHYPEYKDSGVEWLGEVPGYWEVVPIKRCASIRYGIGEPPKYQTEGIPLIRATNIHAGKLYENGLVYVDPSDIPENRIVWLTAGDIIVVRSGAYTGDSAIIPPGLRQSIAGFDMVLRCHSISAKFMQFALLSSYLKNGQIDVEKMRAAQPHLNAEELGACLLILPPPQEQQTISAFLDSETGKIDALIAEQQRLVELLAEKRQAVISHAVTKGLNSNAPMKDSGVEWLGEVPAHWQVMRLGTLFREVSDEGETDRPILSVSIHDGVSDRELDDKELDRKVTRSEDREKYKSVEPGDLVYNMMRAWQGGFGAVKVMGMVSPAYVVARPCGCFETEFIEQQLRSPQAVEEMRRHSRGVTDFRLRLYWDEFKSISIALAPKEEQVDILVFLNKEIAKFDTLTTEANQAIALLQERRSALISAAVTGKIDVRGLATLKEAA